MPSVRIPASGVENYKFGMDSKSNPRALGEHVHQVVENFYPDITGKPRHGITETMLSTARVGQGDSDTLFRQRGMYVQAGGKDFFFVWSKSATYDYEFGLEVWNATDNTRTLLTFGEFPSNQVYVSMKQLYDAVYLTMDYEMSIGRENEFRTRNKILEYNATTGTWGIREYGIDVAPQVTCQTAEALATVLQGRRYHTATIFNGATYIIGGEIDGGYLLDIQKSTDGYQFSHVDITETAYTYDESGSLIYDEGGNIVTSDATGLFYQRCGHTAVVYDNKLWVIGGYVDGAPLADVWFTSDGTNWTRTHYETDIGFRSFHTSVVFANRLYVIAGNNGSADLRDVWYTTDGWNWTQATASAAFSARSAHASVVFNSKMWVVCGQEKDVFSSIDGVNWVEAVADAGMGSVYYHSAVVFLGKMFVIGGIVASSHVNDIYSSSDGATWALETGSPGFSDRSGTAVVAANSGLFLYLGDDGTGPFSSAIYTSANGVAWVIVTSGITTAKAVDLAFTFIRRTDASAFLPAVISHRYEPWETRDGRLIPGVDEVPLTGTVSVTGTALTGVGTAFLTELVAGSDYIRIDGTNTCYLVDSVLSNDDATIVNSLGDSYSGKQAAKLPRVGEAITTTVWQEGITEGIENIEYRRAVAMDSISAFGRIFIQIGVIADAIAQGATHLRVYRTQESNSLSVAQGLSHHFIADIAISGTNVAGNKVYRDGTSNAAVEGETHLLSVTGYSVPPQGRFFDSDTRSWVGGVPTAPGYWFYSVQPTNSAFPQKFAALFSPTTMYNACDPSDGQKDTGTILLYGDRYFFKERKIFRLAGADPYQVPERISDSIGCAFPESITRMFIPSLGGECVGFISELGPCLIRAGGELVIVANYLIGELWPQCAGIIKLSTGLPTTWYSRNKVCGAFWDSAWWLFWGDSRDAACDLPTNTMVGLRFEATSEAIGAFRVTMQVIQGVPVAEPLLLMPKSNLEAYCMSHLGAEQYIPVRDELGELVYAEDGDIVSAISDQSGFKYRLLQFLDPAAWQDSLTDSGAFPYSMISETAYRYVDPSNHTYSAIVTRAIVHIKFDDADGFRVIITSDNGRIVGTCDFVQKRQSGIAADNAFREYVSITIKGKLLGSMFKVRVEKVVPTTGYVELMGVELEGEYHARSPEFVDCTADVNAATRFVVKADAVPEVIL